MGLSCLDETPANVLGVPGEYGTLAAALGAATAGSTVQMIGGVVPHATRIPAYVTLRGCNGAATAASGWVGFAGSEGTLEGFVVKNTVLADETGSYRVQFNRFELGAAAEAPGVAAYSTNSALAKDVTVTVDSNQFDGVGIGIEAKTQYDNAVRRVVVAATNNVFLHVPKPIVFSEGGLQGVIQSQVAFNTFYDFDTAVSLFSVAARTSTLGNLFASGGVTVSGSPWDAAYSLASNVVTPNGANQVGGQIAVGDAVLVDPEAGDVRLGAGSAAIDAVGAEASVPVEDHQGCPRPVSAGAAAAQADIGAFESQP